MTSTLPMPELNSRDISLKPLGAAPPPLTPWQRCGCGQEIECPQLTVNFRIQAYKFHELMVKNFS